MLIDPHPSLPESPGGSQAASGLAARTMTALDRTPDVFEAFFEAARIGLALADLSGRYVRVNATYAELLGLAAEDLIGTPLVEVLRQDESEGGPTLSLLLSGQASSLQAEGSHLRPDGRVAFLLHGIATVVGQDGRPAWFAVNAQDISERRRAELELRAMTEVLAAEAVRDPLTGLANRSLLEDRLRAALARDARTGGSTAVLFLDLDGFKDVNDRYGHAVGDQVLRGVAQRLVGAVRPSDMVARLGGDEFVVLVESATPATVAALLPRVESAVIRPLPVDGIGASVGVSIGVAISRAGELGAAGLIDAADQQMYVAKRAR